MYRDIICLYKKSKRPSKLILIQSYLNNWTLQKSPLMSSQILSFLLPLELYNVGVSKNDLSQPWKMAIRYCFCCVLTLIISIVFSTCTKSKNSCLFNLFTVPIKRTTNSMQLLHGKCCNMSGCTHLMSDQDSRISFLFPDWESSINWLHCIP